ncbi:hypothetical protein BWI96_08010 [Siphonobacter sp. SORGH_AS_0500]|uniref:DUF5695 domain-containing protein n=1 Tax=Siphonobacter sp. SORGH_AS_0500 TaxID=1864824 RepID=UPI000CB18AE5|nr:DUF5695 domain-containing protein [Siphonobacter sp. SORGH_AS_0500]PKK37279.1 hypothetical protein BWI96_08010 [Siphonobacter sp. SORGH_AS_0500]
MTTATYLKKHRGLLIAGLLSVTQLSWAQQSPWKKLEEKPSTLHLEQGYQTFATPELELKLVKSSQTVAGLHPVSEKSFDFTPGDRLKVRSGDGLYQLGDINLRLKVGNEWKSFSSASKRSAVKALTPKSKQVWAIANLSPSFPSDFPLEIQRSWEQTNGGVILRFQIKNPGKEAIELGSLGIPLIFNNILEGNTLEQAHARNVFFDPYIGADAGYLQVARLHGKGSVLLVLPEGNTPFEAYNPLLDDPTPRGIVFEGFHEWMIHSKAHAEKDWAKAQPWNTATSVTLKPGETKSYGLKLVLAPSIREIEKTLIAHKRPVAVGIPGYVVPQDVEAKLFLQHSSKVKSMEVEPAEALSWQSIPSQKKNLQSYLIRGKKWGRARLTIQYQDGLKQTIHYKIIKPESETIADFGNFLTTKQWFEVPKDTFHRSPSVISYDYETKQQVTQDSRAWVAGLSDEGGAGSWLGATMKQLVLPKPEEVQKLERFVNETLWGNIQHKEGPYQYGVRKSLFYYQPDSMPPHTYSPTVNYKSWSAWPHKEAESLGRSYNYPHVAAAHWVLYRLQRNHQHLVKQGNWKSYLENAAQTALGMVKLAPYYAQFGQMEGTVFYLILKDLKREGLTELAAELESTMKKRADLWRSLEYPFGSEMPWDSTGQEEVYVWSYYFGYRDKAEVTLNAILGYMPTIPHWAYNGNARRYWDFLYGGKLSRVERQIHHYGSGLNAIPVLMAYRDQPDDFYLLRVGYGGLMGAIANITEDGFGPAAFHSYPSTLEIDALSGDYGCGFFGYAVNTISYLTQHPEFGWLSFGGNVRQQGNEVILKPTTAARSNVYLSPIGLQVSLDAGMIEQVAYNSVTKAIKIRLQPASEITPTAYLRLEYPAQKKSQRYKLQKSYPQEREAFAIPLKENALELELILNPK